MGIDVEGYIEIRYSDNDNEVLGAWQGVVNISPLISHADVDTDNIFGISKHRSCPDPVAANRGLPQFPSQLVTLALDDWREFEKKESNFSFDELFVFTYISLQEIESHDLDKNLDGSQWEIVFDIMRTLGKRFSPKNIRVVLWAYW